MQQQFNTQQALARVQMLAHAIRQSEAYPAIVGGVSGGVAGALIAILLTGRLMRRSALPKSSTPPHESEAAKAHTRFDLSVRDVVQLATIVAALVKQIQAWTKERAR